MILMPLTFTIYIGIGAGIVCGSSSRSSPIGSDIHWVMWIVFPAYLLFFGQTFIQQYI